MYSIFSFRNYLIVKTKIRNTCLKGQIRDIAIVYCLLPKNKLDSWRNLQYKFLNFPYQRVFLQSLRITVYSRNMQIIDNVTNARQTITNRIQDIGDTFEKVFNVLKINWIGIECIKKLKLSNYTYRTFLYSIFKFILASLGLLRCAWILQNL